MVGSIRTVSFQALGAIPNASAMFRKPFTVKSNTNMKNSARRKLLTVLKTGADAVPSKTQAAQAVVTCASGDIVTVYTFDKVPFFFSISDGQLYPTVYFTWLSPDSYPMVTVPEQVFSYLENGADLMLPGIIRKVGCFPEFPKDSPICISMLTSGGCIKGPVAVGTALMSSADMIASGMQGRGVKILHLYKDYLWDFGPRQHPPVSNPVETCVERPLSDEDFPPLDSLSTNGASVKDSCGDTNGIKANNMSVGVGIMDHDNKDEVQSIKNEATEMVSSEQTEGAVTNDSSGNEAAVDNNQETSEELLLRCFLAALKYRVKRDDLPLDAGEFYLKYLLSTVPTGRRLDMKKTKYKKFTVFLREINKQLPGVPVIEIDEKRKGSEKILEVNYDHPLLKSFERTDEVTEGTRASASKPVTNICEYYSLTEPVVPLFRCVCDAGKGDLLSISDTRHLITTYIKLRGLNEKSGKVSLNDTILGSLVKCDEASVKWDVLFQKVLGKMTKTYVITTVDGTVLKYKLKLPMITFKVETRSGNKKVTLLNNAAAFGIQPKSLCQKVQVSLATSASLVSDAPQCEGPQIVVQGNQVRQISNMLMEEFGIDRKYMVGLELAPKKKK